MSSALMSCAVGLLLGMRHAFEPDHLAAVSTLAAEQRSARAGLWLGALWGVGHTASLLLVCGTLALWEAKMPPAVIDALELAVAVMVAGLGARALGRAVQEGRRGRASTHAHGGLVHTHPAPPEHLHLRSLTLATRPLLVGLMHGLAGSGALTALVLPQLPSVATRMLYVVVFGAGSVVGMAALSGLFGLPLRRLATAPRLSASVLGVAGLLSVGVGVAWGVESGTRLFAG